MTTTVNSNHNSDGNPIVRHYPLLAVVASVICATGWLRWQLSRSAEEFRSAFVQQNLSELASGDTMVLSRRLEALASTLHATCIDGQRSGVTFYRSGGGSCGTGLVHQEAVLNVPGNRDVIVKVTLPLSPDLAGAAVLLILGQVALLVMLARSSRLAERAKMQAILESERADAKVHRAISATTAMVAHDVRKPFSILRMGLGMLGNAKDPESVKKVLARLVPEIDKAVSSVDGLIADVMEVGSTVTDLIQEPVAPESLIEATLGETFRIYPKSSIAISYDLQHTHMVNVHVQKVGRVFSNIVGNAVQAMGQKGQIWFKTRERDGLVEFCVGNGGSLIPAESLPKLFDAFFTSGKKGGTGLGLAIAQKVVTAHGGKIWCESSTTEEYPQGKVEFFFTLPAAGHKAVAAAAELPTHSSYITQALLAIAETNRDESSMDQGELELESAIIDASTGLQRSLRVLIVDDEDIYRQGLATSLARTPGLANKLVVRMAANSEQALELAAKGFDLVITDVDMGPNSQCGFDLVESLRALPGNPLSGALICVHSNRVVSADHKTAIDSGADAFVSKPASRSQILKLVLQAAQKAQILRQGARAAPTTIKPEVLVIDDNIFVLEAWESKLSPDAVVHTTASHEELAERIQKDPEFLNRLALVVTDFHFDGSEYDGQDVAQFIKRQRPSLTVLLSSDGNFKELSGPDRVIGKNPVKLAALESLTS